MTVRLSRLNDLLRRLGLVLVVTVDFRHEAPTTLTLERRRTYIERVRDQSEAAVVIRDLLALTAGQEEKAK